MDRRKDIVREGYLLKCPQKQGILKKWNRRYFVLWRDSQFGSARLEYFDDEWAYGRNEDKRLIPLRDCQGIYQAAGDRDHPYAFEVRTPITSHRLATNSQVDLDHWMSQLRQVVKDVGKREGRRDAPRSVSATMPSRRHNTMISGQPMSSPEGFEMSRPGGVQVRSQTMRSVSRESSIPKRRSLEQADLWGSNSGRSSSAHSSHSSSTATSPTGVNPFDFTAPAEMDAGLQESSAYNSVETEYSVQVLVKQNEASHRVGLGGQYRLSVTPISIQLSSLGSGEVQCTWPLRYIRRYGRDKTKFSFEAGRRCERLTGIFEFRTELGNELFHECHKRIKTLEAKKHESLRQTDFHAPTSAGRGHRYNSATLPAKSSRQSVSISPPLQPQGPAPLTDPFGDLEEAFKPSNLDPPPKYDQLVRNMSHAQPTNASSIPSKPLNIDLDEERYSSIKGIPGWQKSASQQLQQGSKKSTPLSSPSSKNDLLLNEGSYSNVNESLIVDLQDISKTSSHNGYNKLQRSEQQPTASDPPKRPQPKQRPSSMLAKFDDISEEIADLAIELDLPTEPPKPAKRAAASVKNPFQATSPANESRGRGKNPFGDHHSPFVGTTAMSSTARSDAPYDNVKLKSRAGSASGHSGAYDSPRSETWAMDASGPRNPRLDYTPMTGSHFPANENPPPIPAKESRLHSAVSANSKQQPPEIPAKKSGAKVAQEPGHWVFDDEDYEGCAIEEMNLLTPNLPASTATQSNQGKPPPPVAKNYNPFEDLDPLSAKSSTTGGGKQSPACESASSNPFEQFAPEFVSLSATPASLHGDNESGLQYEPVERDDELEFYDAVSPGRGRDQVIEVDSDDDFLGQGPYVNQPETVPSHTGYVEMRHGASPFQH